MLKKIVKFGNSNALVLDKAILELLNMGEGSVVKLKTDGKSLIITPQLEEAARQKPSQSFEEFIYTEYASKFTPDAPTNPTDPKASHEMLGVLRERQKRFKEINEKYGDMQEQVHRVMGMEEYQKELAVLMQEHEQTGDHQAYMTKSMEHMVKYIPNYQAYQAELMEAMNPKSASAAKKA